MQRAQSVGVLILVASMVTPSTQCFGQGALNVSPGDVEPTASRIFTFVQGTGMGHSHGIEAKLQSGRLILGAEQDAGQFVFDMKSFDADTKLAREVVGLEGETAAWMRDQVNKEIHSEALLDTLKFSTATFDIESSRPLGLHKKTGNPGYELVGKLTLKGVTQPIKFPVEVALKEGWLHVIGKFAFKQTDYGIKPVSKGLGSVGVTDQLTVNGNIWIAPSAESTASLEQVKARR